MSTKYEDFHNRVYSKYPELFSRKIFFEVEDGWLGIVESLLQSIHWYQKNNNVHESIKITQVKEKFGGLRFYYSAPDGYEHGKAIYGMILLAESMCTKTCAGCGGKGTLVNESGWYRATCGCTKSIDIENDIVYRLEKRAEIRRQISSRKSVQEGKPDRISDLLEEAANTIKNLRVYR